MEKILIVYYSISHLNTYNLLKNTLKGDNYIFFNVIKDNQEMINFDDFSKIILASGIYFNKMGENLYNFIKINQKELLTKEVIFIFTSGIRINYYKLKMKKTLLEFGIESKTFGTKALDTYGPLKLFGGINKKRPNKDDIKKLEDFLLEVGFLWD